MRLLLVYRAVEYSPNNVDKDAAILDAVADSLTHCQEKAGQAFVESVVRCNEDSLLPDLESYDLILHMARRLSSLVRLERLQHPIVINAARGVRNVAKSRELTFSLLDAAGIAVPAWWAFDPEEDASFIADLELHPLLPGWVKAMRPDGARPEDVVFVQTPLEADSQVLTFASQRIPDIVVTRHLDGDLLKCYCVVGYDGKLPFVHWFYPQESGYSKFGEAEQHNSQLRHLPVDETQLRQLTVGISDALGLQVFGFDAIVQPSTSAAGSSSIYVIDVNDWPTFSICRTEAAEAITQLVQCLASEKEIIQ